MTGVSPGVSEGVSVQQAQGRWGWAGQVLSLLRGIQEGIWAGRAFWYHSVYLSLNLRSLPCVARDGSFCYLPPHRLEGQHNQVGQS